MAGTREGGLKAAAAIKARNPNHYKEAGRKGGLVKGERYRRNEVFQEYVPPIVKPVEEKPKRRFLLWGR